VDPSSRELNVWVKLSPEKAAPPPNAQGQRSCALRRRAASPRVVLGERDGAQAHIQDMLDIVLEERDAMDPARTPHCWVKALFLTTPTEATVMAMHRSYRHSLRDVAEDVDKVLLDIGRCSIGVRCCGDAGPSERQLAVETRFGMECDQEAIIDTAEADLLEESSAGETQDEDEDWIKVVGFMHIAAPNRQMPVGEQTGRIWSTMAIRGINCGRKS